METLLSSLKEKDLNTISDKVHSFFSGASGHPDKLKLSIATASIIEAALSVLSSINYDDYIAELKSKLEDLSMMASESQKKHSAHFELNKMVRNDLGEDDNRNLLSLDEQIEASIERMDEALKQIIELRDRLPIEKIVEKQKP